MPRKIEISHRTIIFIAFLVGFLWFIYFIRDIILQLFVAILIMSILNPTVTKLQKIKIPRLVSVLIVYFLILGFISVSLAFMIPPFIEQTTTFANSLPKYFEDLDIPPSVAETMAREVTILFSGLPSQIIKISVSIFSNVLSILAVFIFALYFLITREKLDEQIAKLFKNGESKEKIDRVINKMEEKLGGWARGEIVLMVLVGLLTYTGLTIIGVPFAIPLALIAGILEIIPSIGPIAAAIPAIIVGFGVSTLTGLATAALGILVQQIENYVFVPKVMEKSVGVHPIITLLSLIIGFKIAGVVGAMLSVPIAITSKILLEEFVFSRYSD